MNASLENDRVFLLRAPWNRDFLDELRTFPDGAHDDQVDALALALNVQNRASNWRTENKRYELRVKGYEFILGGTAHRAGAEEHKKPPLVVASPVTLGRSGRSFLSLRDRPGGPGYLNSPLIHDSQNS